MTDARNGRPLEQHNHGAGLFVGRDYIETLDKTTKEMLRKLSEEAPALGNLLTRALHDGVISPDTVVALERATSNINEGVAMSLRYAGENINEGVAASLRAAADSINGGVALTISTAAKDLSEAATTIDRLGSFNTVQQWADVASEMSEAADNLSIAAQARASTGTTWSWNSFHWGLFVATGLVIVLLTLFDLAIRN